MPPVERAALDDNDPTTNVSGFNTGFCNGGGLPITVNILASGAPNSGANTVINNELPSRWGMTSFNNQRSSLGTSGNQYCFEFSEPLPLEVSSKEHQFFHDNEQIRVTAFFGGFSVNLSGALGGIASSAEMNGNGTPFLHFDAKDTRGTGVWWEANTQGIAVDMVCVEYYSTSDSENRVGAEPFTLSICNSDRCIFDDQFARADPDNPSPGPNIADNVLFTKETYCAAQAASGKPGNMDVTFRLRARNNGTNTITTLQVRDDLRDQIPADIPLSVLNLSFGPDNNLTTNPTLNGSFNGQSNLNLLTGTDGTMAAGQTLAIDLEVEMDVNAFQQYELIRNQSNFSGIGNSFNLISATSDAPVGAPGHNQGDTEGLLINIPSINLATHSLDYDYFPEDDAEGEVEVTLELRYENTGNVILDKLALTGDFAATLGYAFLGIVEAPTIVLSSALQNPTINPNFDGTSSQDEIFDGMSGLLERGDVVYVRTRIRLNPNELGAPLNAPIQFKSAARGLFPDLKPLPGCHDDDELWAFDSSDAGLVPESENSPFIGDTGGHNDPLPLLLPNMDVVKEISSYSAAASNVPGNVDVVFRMEIENTGNVDLNNLTLTDDVITQLGSTFVSMIQAPQIVNSSATTNPVLSGTFGAFFNGTSGLLEPNQTIEIEFIVEMDPDAGNASSITNQAEVSGTGLWIDGSTQTITAQSDSGSETESINTGAPGDQGTTIDATLLSLPNIMVAQEIVGVDYATSGTSGHFDAIIQVLVQNTGSVDLDDFQLVQNLGAAQLLGSAFVGVTSAPQIIPVGAHGTLATATTDPQVNPTFNGNGDLLNDTNVGLLAPGEIFIVQYQIEVDPEASGVPSVPKLQTEGFANGNGPSGNTITVSDLSDSGFTPQSTNPGQLGDSGNSNDPTLLTNCGAQIGTLSCNNSVQISMNEDCLAGLTASMVLEGEFWHCDSDNLLPLGSYYEIFMVTTPFGTLVQDAIPATPNVFEIDGSYVGQTLTVKIQDVVNSNSCWGTISLEDKLGPTFACPSPILIDCFDELSTVGPPVATDNCDPDPEVTFLAQNIIDDDICDDGIYRVRRTYTAHDQYGNQAANQCVFEIHLTRPDITFPGDINWFCEQYASYPNVIEPVSLHPIVKDQITTTTVIDVNPNLSNNVLSNTGSGQINNTGGVCGYHVSHSDQTIAACGNTFHIIRTWTAIDWCTGQIITVGANGEDNLQTIKVIDETAPTISKNNFQVSATIPSTQFQACRSQGLLPPPDSFSDNCQPNDELEVQIVTSIGEAIYIGADGKLGGLIPPPGLPIGFHPVVYRIKDDCGNLDSVVVQVQVVDDITPTAVCDELTEANLNTSGIAEVFAATFDDGSHDNCCLVGDFEVRRMNDPCDDGQDDTVFGPSVNFCCADVDAGPQMVVFRVYDCVGNYNDCMVEVVVNDKQEPLLLHCPPNARITCNEYADDFETQLANLAGNQAAQNELFDAAFGTPIFQDNCDFDLIKNLNINIDQCLEGNIRRRWRAVDPGGLTSPLCTQQIYVDHVSDWVVEFAPDVTINCGETLPDFVEPEVFFDDCEMVGISFEDVVSTTVPDACFKVERTWLIMNWCVAGDDATDDEVVELPESQLGLPFPACDLDGDGDCDDRTFRDSWTNIHNPDAGDATQNLIPDTDPDSDPWDGVIVYKQVIKAVDTVNPVFTSGCGTLPDICITDNSCDADVTLVVPTADDCSPNLTFTAVSDMGIGFGPFTDVAPGNYAITFNVNDNCNNQTSCQANVTVRDCKDPSPKCKPGLNVGIMDTSPPMITVTADSLNDGSHDNCPGDLIFSFSMNVTNTIDTFFCSDVGPDTVEIWVTDLAGNQDFCTTVITVQDNLNNCNDDSLVVNLSGVIDTEMGDPVEGVNITLSGQSSSIQTTPLSGDFTFADIPTGNDVTITPSLNVDPLNGVTTFDLVQMSKHVLGISELDSPYKMIAADVNNSGNISTFDMLQLRKMILFIDLEFPNNTSWRFVDKNFTFPNPSDPWETPFPEIINVNDIPSDVLDADFVAIKIGDINGSASTNLLGSTDDRNMDETFILHGEERNLTRGEKFSVSLSAKDFDLNGFQFTLQFDADKVEFLEAEDAQLMANNFGYTFIEDGYLTVSWNGEMQKGMPMAKLRFRALENCRLGNAFQANSRYTPAEAYRTNGELMDVELQFSDGDVASNFELYQNVPNPFSDATVISFHLPRASMASLTISDVRGRTVRTVTDLYEAGYNEIELGKDQLPSNGIFYYRLETPTDSDTKTMILLN